MKPATHQEALRARAWRLGGRRRRTFRCAAASRILETPVKRRAGGEGGWSIVPLASSARLERVQGASGQRAWRPPSPPTTYRLQPTTQVVMSAYQKYICDGSVACSQLVAQDRVWVGWARSCESPARKSVRLARSWSRRRMIGFLSSHPLALRDGTGGAWARPVSALLARWRVPASMQVSIHTQQSCVEAQPDGKLERDACYLILCFLFLAVSLDRRKGKQRMTLSGAANRTAATRKQAEWRGWSG